MAAAFAPPFWVKLVAMAEMCAVFVTGYTALFFKFGLVTCGSWQPLCIPTLGSSAEGYESMLRSWGARQACIFVPFACALAWQDRNVYRAAFACFISRCLHDLLSIALDGFQSDSILSFCLVLGNTALASFTLYSIWKDPGARERAAAAAAGATS
jgi:hypothetical protein